MTTTTVVEIRRTTGGAATLPILKLSADRKTTESARWSAGNKRWEPKVRNAFGLPAVVSCPGSTAACRAVCYADGVPWPSARALLEHNYEALRDASLADMVAMLSRLVEDFLAEWNKVHNGDADGRRRQRRPIFRIHWSGDFFSSRYARAWATVCRMFPSVDFWTYTRSFRFVGLLAGVDNLTVYLSADADNAAAAHQCAAKHGLPIAYMGVDGLEPREDQRLGALVCPETAGRIPLVSDRGEGACASCRACIRGNRDIRFVVH